MPIVGLRKSFYSKYEPDESGVYKYTGGGAFARMIDVTVTPETNDAELHSDDNLEESDYSFVKAALKVTASDLDNKARADILGITIEESGEMIYGEAIQSDVGFGFIIVKKKSGVESFRAIVLTRVKFKIPEDTAATRAGKMTYQTQALEGTCSRDFSDKKAWKRENTFKTETEAVEYIKTILGLSEQPATTDETESD